MTSLAEDTRGGTFGQQQFQNFEEFEAHELKRASMPRNKTWFPLVSSPPLYRGQANPSWKLETTLERKKTNTLALDYYGWVRRAHPEIASVSGKFWDIPTPADVIDWCSDYNRNFGLKERLLAPEYLTYLRHYGFPSPLLDWTRSIYIATFFAYRHEHDLDNENISIYILDNIDPDLACATVSTPQSIELCEVGQFINTDKRHFLQQSTYTTCLSWTNNQWYFASHESFFESESSKNIVMRKCLLPASQRNAILKRLDFMNINAFSLFGTIEALMETKSNRELGY